MRHTISVLVENKPGVLAKVSGLFARRGYNIESLAVSITHDPEVSRITIVVEGNDNVLEQIQKQLNKLIPVIKVSDLTSMPVVARELALVKVRADARTRSEILQIVDIFRGAVVDVSETTLIIAVNGGEGKIDALENMLKRFNIMEVVRTGKVVLARGKVST